MDTALYAFNKTPVYKGKTLVEWFGDLLKKSDSDLDREGSNFLKVLTTWVVRQYADRRRGGVPMGHLEKFAYPASQKIDFTRTVMVYIVRTLRKRGLRETDMSRKSLTFDQLVAAYDRTAQRR